MESIAPSFSADPWLTSSTHAAMHESWKQHEMKTHTERHFCTNSMVKHKNIKPIFNCDNGERKKGKENNEMTGRGESCELPTGRSINTPLYPHTHISRGSCLSGVFKSVSTSHWCVCFAAATDDKRLTYKLQSHTSTSAGHKACLTVRYCR